MNHFLSTSLSILNIGGILIIIKITLASYWLERRPSPIAILCNVGMILLLWSITSFFPTLLVPWIQGALSVFITGLVFSDTFLYRYFNDLNSVVLIKQASALDSVKDSLRALISWKDLFFISDWIVLIPLVLFHPFQRFESHSVLLILASVFSGGALFVFSFATAFNKNKILFKHFDHRPAIAGKAGFLGYHLLDIYHSLFYKKTQTRTAVTNEKLISLIQSKATAAPENRVHSEPLNLLVLQIESLQSFVLNRFYNGIEITPNLNRLACNNLSFRSFYCQTAAGGTSDAEFLTQNSLFPAQQGAAFMRFGENTYYGLPAILKEHGYQTAVYHAYNRSFWNRDVIYPNMGFDHFYGAESFATGAHIGMGLNDIDFFAQTINKIKEMTSPWYSLAISLSSHHPYSWPWPQQHLLTNNKTKPTLLENYLNGIHYLDYALGTLLERLEAEGIMKNTVVALYGDHFGIPKANKKELAQFLGKSSLSPLQWQHLQKTPLVICAPGVKPNLVDTPGGGLDLAPTLLHFLNINSNDAPLLGRNLMTTQDPLVVFRNGNIINNDGLWLVELNQWFDLHSDLPLKKEPPVDLLSFLKASDQILSDDLQGVLAQSMMRSASPIDHFSIG